jgi:uncharacterized protein with von Willebrand factor type A (vWA) domain
MKKPKRSKKVVTKPAKGTIKTQIAIILDRSGSMSFCAKETVDAFNEQVKTIRQSQKKGMDTRVSLFTFATVADEPKFFDRPVSSLEELGYADYQPNGYTAMYDAVGKAIGKLESLKMSKDTAYLLVIISDGQENNSKEFTSAVIADKIKALQGTKHWTVTYLGANQDLSQVSKVLNIPLTNVHAFAATDIGVKNASVALSGATMSYLSSRSSGKVAVDNFYEKKVTTTTVTKTTA